jgi:hypothetical protein
MTTSDSKGVRWFAALIGVVVVLGATGTARADTDEQRAVTLFEKGRKLARDGRCAEAIGPLLESIHYVEGVGPLLNLGNCSETLGRTASAYRYFVRAEEVAGAKGDGRREEAAQRARVLEKEVPTLVVHVPAEIRASAEVHLDGDPLPRDRWETPVPVDPGSHALELLAPPRPAQTRTVKVAKGEHANVVLTAPSVPSEPGQGASRDEERRPTDAAERRPGPQRTLGLVAGGAGAVGLAVGAIFGVMSISAHASVVGRCPTYPTCPASDRADLDDLNGRAHSTGTISTVAVIAGLALLAGGALLYLTADAKRP